MYLKSVEMQGFKSFANKIFLDFNPGITAIVGPNGSGKSNISDAIRWVMGEQSVKTLRGSKMEDVIFAGTQERRALGFAEVSLTLDNTSKIFPVDFDEVTVTRRVYRSGEGEYYINKSACRLKDIHELFMDTGLGREGYSIIGQGKIDEILSNKSEDRRQIFEEAAGITKYKYRKNEARKKLENTNENLTRLSDIMKELEGQLEPLKEQAEKAKKFLALRDELKILDVNMSVFDIKKSKEELSELEKQFKELSFNLDLLQNEIDRTEQNVNGLYDDIKNTENEIESLRENEKENFSAINEYTNKTNLLASDIEHETENIKRIKNDIEKSSGSGKYLDSVISDYKNRISALNEKKASVEAELSLLRLEYDEKLSKSENAKKDYEKLSEEIIFKQSENVSLKEKTESSLSFMEEYKNRKERISKEIAESDEKSFEFDKKLNELLNIKNESEKKAKKASEDFDIAKYAFKKSNDLLGRLLEEKNRFKNLAEQKKSKMAVLYEMEQELDGYSKSVKAVMTAHREKKLGGVALHGPLSTLIHTENDYTTAIEVALQNANQNIVTDSEEDAKAAIEYLRKNNLGRATFLPISAAKPRTTDVSKIKNEKGYIAIASELVSSDSLYSGVVSSVLGAVVVADNIDNAIRLAKLSGHKLMIVTLRGDLLRAGGAITGGSLGKNIGFLSRSAEIEKLKTEIAEAEEKIAETEKEYVKTSEKTGKLLEKSTEAEKYSALCTESYIKANSEYESFGKLVNSLSGGKETLKNELSDIENKIAEFEKNIIDYKEKISANEKFLISSKEEKLQLETLMKKFDEDTASASDGVVKINLELSGLIKDTEHQEERLKDVSAQRDNVDNVNIERKSEIEERTKKIEEMKARIAFFEKERESLEKRTVITNKNIEELGEKKTKINEKIRKLQEESKNTRQSFFSVSQQKSKIEGRKARGEAELDAIFDRLWEEYELTYSEAEKIAAGETEFNRGAAAKRISEIKINIKNLGNINIDAIEGYKSVKERFDFLSAQTEDLSKAKEELESVIEELLRVMKTQFAENFAIINKNFNSVFKELFGGGTAKLELSDPENILESGIEIEAQPPGKKLQSLTLLSGGERAFTAIALLFAILNVRPTPFCILDEIEAALDDVNVYRYADYLKKYSGKTQFIVVTHRRGTMEAANILYGVTMQERGVSKLLSLNIDEVVE